MEEQSVVLESFYEKAKEYANTNLELARLKAVDKTADLVSSLVPRLIVLLFLLIFIVVANIAISLWLGDLMGKSWYGFLTVSGFYLFMALVVHYFLQPSLKRRIANTLITRLLN